ncbi:sigma-70 family RNA polymerase sigma factor [Fuerstiella marisgermanici]|nr:sigma-70 family RNA polymerase sigma factor [Fuerstiella marisgermanici]
MNKKDPAAGPDKLPPDQWVGAYGDYLFRYAVSRLRDQNAAEEVVQETLLAGIRFQSQFAGKGSQRGWLMGILKRKIIDFVRRRDKHARDSKANPNADATDELFKENGFWKKGVATWSAVPDGNLESSELWEIVAECLKHLPDGQADAFVLSVLEEMDSDRICEALEITDTNLWVRLHRARLRLAVCVGSKWNDE